MFFKIIFNRLRVKAFYKNPLQKKPKTQKENDITTHAPGGYDEISKGVETSKKRDTAG